ncbi:MAG: STAS domain-containing protein [Planctomycetaceae bacterium]
MTAPHRLFTTEDHEDSLRICLQVPGIRGPESISQLDRELTQWLSLQTGRSVVLDFSDLVSVTSDFLAKLIGWQRQIVGAGGNLRLAGLNSDLRELFEITRLSKRFEIISDDRTRHTNS